jgi:seryl-tRNA synthetase
MIDVNIVRENQDMVREGLTARNRDAALVDRFLAVDTEWRAATTSADALRAELNALSRARDVAGAKAKKTALKDAEARTESLAKERGALLDQFPNTPSPEVPRGKSAADNAVLREVGEKPRFDFEPRDYLTIAEHLGVIDVKKAAEVSGSRFGYLKGDAALLEFALVRYAMRILTARGFTPVIPPVMIKPEPYAGMGRLAADQKEERYYLPADDLYLVGSAEHTIGPMHMNDTLREKDLPLRYAGFSACFRREAGSYGKDTKGILRVHQFDKVEMFSFASPERSEEEHRFLLSCQEELLQGLKLPYRVVQICTGDMGWTDAKQYDCETWLPGQPNAEGGKGVYRETNSCSNTTDFQARGINCKTDAGRYVHMLNATGLALGRIIIAIIENYQKANGAFAWPDALQKL